MTYEETLTYIHSTHWQGKRPGLSRVGALLEGLDDPQKQLRFVHVAGTNGKGSVCACMSSILQAAGYRTGCFTSPFLERFNERFQIDGVPISDEALCQMAERVRPVADKMEDTPNEFDLITALALAWFAEEECDIVVLEVGLGGTLDPTNVIDCPDLAVITALGLDHTRQLGSTLPEIAAAKGGIIKPGGQVVYYGGAPGADEVIYRVCREQRASMTIPDWTELEVLAWELDCTRMNYGGLNELRLPLLAAYQPRNAALAITGARLLRNCGWDIPESAIRQGLETVCWPGRFELLRKEPPFLLDGSHNPQGVRATAESLALRYPGRRFVFLMGVMADKDAASMISPLAPLATEFVTVTPPSPRSLPAEELAEEIRRLTGMSARACDSVEQGVETALERCRPDTGVCALGSLYFSGAIRHAAVARF